MVNLLRTGLHRHRNLSMELRPHGGTLEVLRFSVPRHQNAERDFALVQEITHTTELRSVACSTTATLEIALAGGAVYHTLL